jgi:methionyl-tRNA formyltransferase
VVGLVTQPDRAGPGRHHHRPAIKDLALERGVPVVQPPNANAPEALNALRAFQADLFVVAAYGQILSQELLEVPRLGAVNIHASLLPKYRGAAPVQYAVWKGDVESGVTLFRIEPRLDAGPILAMETTPIRPPETAGELEARLARLAVPTTLKVLDQIERDGCVVGTPQDAQHATRAPRLKKSDGAIDWSRSPREIDCHVRAMQPWPKAFSYLNQAGKPPLRLLVLQVAPAAPTADAVPGTVVCVTERQLMVQTGAGCLEIKLLQPEGKRAMETADFLRGHLVLPGDRFTPQ